MSSMQNNNLSQRLLLRPAEAGELMGLSRSVVYELIRKGDLAVLRIGGKSIRIPMASIQDYIVRNTQEARSDNDR